MTATAVIAGPAWCTNGDRCDHDEHWSDDLMLYVAASFHAEESPTAIGLPAQVGAGPVGRERGVLGVVVHADNYLGDTEIVLTVDEARELARHILRCADVVEAGL